MQIRNGGENLSLQEFALPSLRAQLVTRGNLWDFLVVGGLRHCEQLDSAFLQNLMRGNLFISFCQKARFWHLVTIDCHASLATCSQ
ncbi:hypothetical protein [Helicobacter sp. T3_23-1056]